MRLFFLIAYHYSLLTLTGKDGCHFPGLLVLDFPAELEDVSSVADKENFVLEPFVELLAKEQYLGCQVIVAGGAFEDLAGAHRIECNHIWR